MNWKIDSWREKPIKQQPTYRNMDALLAVEEKLKTLPPLVFAGEVDNLKADLAKVSQGKAFFIQGGDCAESFKDFDADNIKDFFKVILQMSVVLTYTSSLPIVKIGRIAGQFAKPRSSDNETIDGVTHPSYRGDIVNDIAFTKEAREPDEKRLLEAYFQSATTQNLLRAFARGGFADLHKVNRWNLDFIKDVNLSSKYKELADNVTQALGFMKAIGINTNNSPLLSETVVYTSHEALLLNYEEALTRVDSITGKYYGCSAHMLWIGDRTRDLKEAHVEFLRGVQNPIGIKAGPTTKADDLVDLVKRINPDNEHGKLNIIVRMGAEKIAEYLPALIAAIKEAKVNVVWSIDPMHGNTYKARSGYKTRKFDSILKEVKEFFRIHKELGTYAGGIHLEMTGKDVTECVGGSVKITEQGLARSYDTHCDPRLNAKQALELSFLISDILKER